MEHHTFNARAGQILFHTWEEGVSLYHRLSRAAPTATALVVMPNHIHILTHAGARPKLSQAIRCHARAFNKRHGTEGSLFQPTRAPTLARDHAKIAYNERYIWLNPCRANLTGDPLAWPLSDYRDALGLGLRPRRAQAPRPSDLSRFVGSDPTCIDAAAQLPVPTAPTIDDVRACAAWLLRTSVAATHTWGPARALAIRIANTHTGFKSREIAEQFSVGIRAVQRGGAAPQQAGSLVGDSRIQGCVDTNLTTLRWADWVE